MPIRLDQDSRGVITAWLDNAPKRNALDDEMLGALATLLENLAGRSDARAVIIRGRNGNFCSGRDLGELAPEASRPDTSPTVRLRPINRLAEAFHCCPVPTIAFVEGKAAGLGVSLACWSDLAMAADDASFSLPEARVGIAPSITAVSLMQAVGPRWAMDLCLTGRILDTATAARIGLVQYTCKSSEGPHALEGVLKTMLEGAPGAQRLTKELARKVEGMTFNVALAAAHAIAERSMDGVEIAEGLAARRERRLPAWQQDAGAQTLRSSPS